MVPCVTNCFADHVTAPVLTYLVVSECPVEGYEEEDTELDGNETGIATEDELDAEETTGTDVVVNDQPPAAIRKQHAKQVAVFKAFQTEKTAARTIKKRKADETPDGQILKKVYLISSIDILRTHIHDTQVN